MAHRSSTQHFILLGSLLAGTAVAAGAFGAHALKGVLDPPRLAVFDTATRYQMLHAFGIFFVAWAAERYPDRNLERAGWLFTIGVLLFSGSLYGVSLAGIAWLGAVTPIGGLAFIAGWFALGWNCWRVSDAQIPRS